MRRITARLACLLLLWLWLPAASYAQQPAESRREVVVGLYLNDIQRLDLEQHLYVVDFYIWFRWDANDPDPTTTFEFMNDVDPHARKMEALYDAPKPQPNGSLYQLYRYQGAFSSKFPLQRYPFDSQELRISLEDGEAGIQDFVYVPDKEAFTLGQRITLPGYKIGKKELRFRIVPYATTFGDLAEKDTLAYARAEFVITIEKPLLSAMVKTAVPVLLILFGASFALFVDPAHIEARLGFGITALITLAALQFTMKSDLPTVGYLTVLDQVYLLSYVYILATLGHIVHATRFDDAGYIRGDQTALEKVVASGPRFAGFGGGVYLFGIALILLINLL